MDYQLKEIHTHRNETVIYGVCFTNLFTHLHYFYWGHFHVNNECTNLTILRMSPKLTPNLVPRAFPQKGKRRTSAIFLSREKPLERGWLTPGFQAFLDLGWGACGRNPSTLDGEFFSQTARRGRLIFKDAPARSSQNSVRCVHEYVSLALLKTTGCRVGKVSTALMWYQCSQNKVC